MDTLTLHQAQQACRDVVVSTAEAVDLQDYDALIDLFAEDALLIRPGGTELRGHFEILAAYQSKDSNRMTHHLICNHQVKVLSPVLAESRCKVLLYATERTRALTSKGRLADHTHQVGSMHDELVLTNLGWKISRRRAWFELLIEG